MCDVCLQSLTSGNVWGDKDKNDDQQSGWNVDNFMQVAKELVSSKINYYEIKIQKITKTCSASWKLRLVLYFGIERRKYINLLKECYRKLYFKYS